MDMDPTGDHAVHIHSSQTLSSTNFRISQAGDGIPEAAKQHLEGAALAIWTTTPWTMPANMAVAVNAKLEYAVVQAQVRCGFTRMVRGAADLGRSQLVWSPPCLASADPECSYTDGRTRILRETGNMRSATDAAVVKEALVRKIRERHPD